MRTNCYFSTSDPNSGIAVGFSDPDFLKQRNNFVIRRSYQAVTLTDLDLDICSTSMFNAMKDYLLSGLRIAEGLVICCCTFSLVPSCPNSLSGPGP